MGHEVLVGWQKAQALQEDLRRMAEELPALSRPA
jgi:hypothetical protein